MNHKTPLIEKYRVKKFSDIKGQDLTVQEVKTFLQMFPKKKAVILNGPVGTGKTSMAFALAESEGLELFELNASDLRNRSSLEEVLRPSIEQKSLFSKGKLILMDEADGITASDRGGLPELVALIAKTSYPIIITANDIWQKKFSLLRKKCQIINVKELNQADIRQIIIDVLHKEGKRVKLETLNMIATQARGDVRAALNDLESVLELGEDAFVEEISQREKQESIFDALKKVFQSKIDENTLRIFDNTQIQLDEISLWIEENIPLEYQNEALAKAYESLSRADIFKGRIYRQQYWRFLVYQSFFLSGGISAASKEKKSNFVSYKKPTRILKIWISNQKNAKSKSIVGKYASFCHMSKKKAMKDKFLLPFILDGLDDKTRKKMDIEEFESDYLLEKKGAVIVAGGLNKFNE
jgi:replication factor C large subunit